MDVNEAERSGLVSRIVPQADLLETALKVAAEIAAMPPLAVLANKELVDATFETTLDQGLLHERRVFQIITATEDKTEGMSAFVEKRAGVWKGR
jgi:enoyl-CoA hydratase